jgi:hypothetical protein
MKPLKAMVLAAGKGTRLFPLTGEVPKPMALVAGKPMIQHIFDLLAGHKGQVARRTARQEPVDREERTDPPYRQPGRVRARRRGRRDRPGGGALRVRHGGERLLDLPQRHHKAEHTPPWRLCRKGGVSAGLHNRPRLRCASRGDDKRWRL